MNKVGHIIKSARIEKNLSIDKVSIDLNISRDVIKKFEKDENLDDYDKIFYIGHLRSYCNYLNLDTKLIINTYKRQISFNNDTITDKIPKPKLNNNSFQIQKFLPSTFIIILLSSFYFLFIKETKNEIDYALVPDIPEADIPVIEKFSLNDKLNNTNIKNKNLFENIEEINISSAVALIK